MVEAEVWAVDAEQGHGLLDQVGRIRADGEHVLVEGHWAEFVSRRVIPDLETGEEIALADNPERWVASLIQLIRTQSVGYLHVIQRIAVPVRNAFGEPVGIELEVDVAEDTLTVPSFLSDDRNTQLREHAARLAAEARLAVPLAEPEREQETSESRTRRAQNA